MDLGECDQIHDSALRADFKQASTKRDYCFEYDALQRLEKFIRECDKKTEDSKRHLKETQDALPDEASEQELEVFRLGEEIGTKLAKAEQFGMEGEVEASLALQNEVEALNKEKAEAEAKLRSIIPSSQSQQQKLRVCEVCSAYLGVHDNDRRLADHFGGKLHLGFIEIRQSLEDLKAKVQERKKSSNSSSQNGGGSSSSSRRYNNREDERGDDHHHRHHHSSSYREKDRDRERERDRERDRDRSSKHHKKSRRRERSRS